MAEASPADPRSGPARAEPPHVAGERVEGDRAARVQAFLHRHHPFDLLPEPAIADLVARARLVDYPQGAVVLAAGEPVASIHILLVGAVDAFSVEGEHVSRYAAGEPLGVRALLRDKPSAVRAAASEPTRALALAPEDFLALLSAHPAVDAYFDRLRSAERRRGAPREAEAGALFAAPLSEVMTAGPVSVSPQQSVREAASIMRERRISCVLVEEADGALAGILTTGDLTGRIIAEGRGLDTPVGSVMTPAPATLPPDALVFDAMILMSERGIGHLPIADDGHAQGILTRTNLVRRQSISAMFLIGDLAKARTIQDMRAVLGRLPELLVQLVGAGVKASRVGFAITSVADQLTRRLLELAEERLGPPPVPYLWLACGSQGRREQTGISDQDNCLILDDAYASQEHDAYFEALATSVVEGLAACGYYLCPGEMMASNPKWRQPLRVWRTYFRGWIARPDPMAQMLASVMFDLRPIHGESALYSDLQEETLRLARANSIFRAHMVANSLKHTPPLGLFRGFALIRSGEHKDTVDLKHSGIVPIVDLARVYALEGAIPAVNTRERILAARDAGTLSESGGADLLDAYDLIGDIRLRHQAGRIRAGEKPDNYLAPSTLSALERNHLKDAFGVVKSLQSALAHGRSAAG